MEEPEVIADFQENMFSGHNREGACMNSQRCITRTMITTEKKVKSYFLGASSSQTESQYGGREESIKSYFKLRIYWLLVASGKVGFSFNNMTPSGLAIPQGMPHSQE